MIRRLGALAVLTLIAFPAGAAGAAVADAADKCVAAPSHVIALELLGCRPAEIAIEEQLAGTRVWWLRPYMLSIAEANPGVILRGRVSQRRTYEMPRDLGPWKEHGYEEEFFYVSRDGNLCEAFSGVEEALLLAEPPCCDVIPPVSVGCLLEIDESRTLPQRLVERMDEIEDEEDADDEEGYGG